MKDTVNTYISKGLDKYICKEKERLRLKEKNKRGKKRRITRIDACNSILRKLLK